MKTYGRTQNTYLRFFAILLIIFTVFVSVPPIEAYADDAYETTATAAIVVNTTRDMVLYEKDADKQVYPASTTKVLMALVVSDSIKEGKYSLEDTFAAYDDLYFDIPWDGSTEYIQPGEIMTVDDYLHCALMSSANEACNALAVFDSGDVDKFVEKMNEKVAELGCTNSHFSDAHGIHHDDHYTTAREMYMIFRAALEDPIVGSVVTTREYVVPETNMSEERELYNTNMLIQPDKPLYYEYALGGKTGYTDEGGSCLVSAAEKDGERLICIIMGADIEVYEERVVPGSFIEARNLYEWCYSEYNEWQVLMASQTIQRVPVIYGKDADSVDVAAVDDIRYYMAKTDAENNITYDVKLKKEPLKAPVHAGDKVGTVSLVYNGETIASSDVVAAANVNVSVKELIKGSFGARIVLVLILIAIAIIIRLVILNSRVKRGGRR